MKRRILLIILAVFFCVFLAVSLAGKSVISQLECCVIQYDKLVSEYTISCTVHGGRHYCCYEGWLTEIVKQEGQKLKKDDVIARYSDSRGRSAVLKSPADGWLISLSGSQAVIEDGELMLYGYVPAEKYELLKAGQQGSFSVKGEIFLAEIAEKNDLAIEDGIQRSCQLVLKTEDRAQLMSGQKVNVLMPLQQVYGLCVDARALLVDEEGYWLLDSEAAKDLTNWKRYRLSVQVMVQSQGKAIISGVQLENREVLILPEEYRKVLSGDD